MEKPSNSNFYCSNMSIIKKILLGIAFMFWIYLTYTLWPMHGIIRYDCTIAEISPDFPPEVKNDCRKLIYNNSKSKTTRV